MRSQAGGGSGRREREATIAYSWMCFRGWELLALGEALTELQAGCDGDSWGRAVRGLPTPTAPWSTDQALRTP